MFSYHLWMDITDEHFLPGHADHAFALSWIESRATGAHQLVFANGSGLLHSATCRNRPAAELEELLAFVERLAARCPESHGLLITVDDERDEDPVDARVIADGRVQVRPVDPVLARVAIG